MTNSAFDAKRAQDYDHKVEEMIPCYSTMQHLTEVFLSTELLETASILIVGAGTGAEVIQCGKKHPGWTLTAVDPSPEMIQLGRGKTEAAGLSKQVEWQALPLNQLKTETPFDAATLLLVLHFLNDDMKLDLLTEISERLKPGAPLVVSTFVGEPENTRTKKLYELGKANALANGLDREYVEERLNLKRKDLFLVPEERIKTLLREAGFIDIQRIVQGLAMMTWVARTNR